MQFVTIEHHNGAYEGTIITFKLSPFPRYILGFVLTLTHVVDQGRVEALAKGDLTGKGTWTLHENAGVSNIDFDWDVVTTRPWMNRFAFLLHPFFTFMHHEVMRWGGQGLARYVDAQLISIDRIN